MDIKTFIHKIISLLFWFKNPHLRKYPKMEVKFNSVGFTLFQEERQTIFVEWSNVREVFAYKDDLWAYDEICVGFRFNDAGEYWWVGEDFIGYQELLEELKKQFPGIKTDWFSEVAFPAFKQNRTTLWGTPYS